MSIYRSITNTAPLMAALTLLCLSGLTWGALPDTVERLKAGVVGIGTMTPVQRAGTKRGGLKFRGTGFAVGDGTLIATSYHVVALELDSQGGEIFAVLSGRGTGVEVHPAVLAAKDVEHDLALLKISDTVLPALELDQDDNVREGQNVAFTGFPIGTVLGLYPATHRGIVSAITPIAIPAPSAKALTAAHLRRIRALFDVLQLDATAYPGNSGSPVYEPESGQVVGVLNSVFIKQTRESMLENPSGISYAIPVAHLRKLVQGQANREP